MWKGCVCVKQSSSVRRPFWWLLPLALALPFAGGLIWVWGRYGNSILDLLNVALKLVVVP